MKLATLLLSGLLLSTTAAPLARLGSSDDSRAAHIQSPHLETHPAPRTKSRPAREIRLTDAQKERASKLIVLMTLLARPQDHVGVKSSVRRDAARATPEECTIPMKTEAPKC